MSVISGIFGAEASKSAADTQADAAGNATAATLAMFNQTRADQAPWLKQGSEAITKVGDLINKGPGKFKPEEDPGYKFGYQEFVENPTLKLASATGKLGSGATLKALTRYASDYASTKYDNFLDRYYKSLDPYLRTAGMGSNVAIAGGNQSGNAANSTALTTLAGGSASAAGTLGASSAYTNAGKIIGNKLMDYYTKPTTQSWGSTLAGSAAGADSMSWL
jgi:hypothetical protein